MADEREVEVRRSRRRRRTVSAYREGGRTIVLIPARFSKAEEAQWVGAMLDKLAKGDRRRRPSDDQLSRRAAELSTRYLGGLARAASVRWVSNQRSRWGSCTPTDATIRISGRLKGMPGYVLDYVLLHELAHLLQPAHDHAFWRLLAGYPRLERARGYLEGVAAEAGLDMTEDDASPEDVEDDALEQDVSEQNVSEHDVSEQDVSEQNVSEQNVSEQNVSEQDVQVAALEVAADGTSPRPNGWTDPERTRLF